MKIKILIVMCCLFAQTAYSMGNFSKKCNFDAIVFDIGSGASKSYRYNIDLCNHEMKFKTVDEKVMHIQYQECISSTNTQDFIPPICLQDGEKSVKDFMSYYNIDCRKNACLGVATAWARNAINANKIIEIYQKYGIDIEVIDQGQEGILSFESAVSVLSDDEKKKALVLDLGGGSHQISYYDKHDNIEIYLGDLGNSNFHQALVEKFGTKALYDNDNSYLKLAIIEDVLSYANVIIGDQIRGEISIEYNAVYGLGRSIYNYLTKNLGLGPEKVTKTELKAKIVEFSGYSHDHAVEKFKLTAHSFAPYMQTSLIILYTILDALELDEMQLLPVRMTDSILMQYLRDHNMERGYN